GGLLLPQIESADTLSDELKKPGMLVYNKTDGKVYTYNGAAWSAGSGGDNAYTGPASCNGSDSVTGVSGTVYPIGSYPNAPNDLKSLCWMLSNLKEPGSDVLTAGEKGNGGYFYSNAPVTFCADKLGVGWRIPSADDWSLFDRAYNTLTIGERAVWQWPAEGAGGIAYYRSENGVSKWRPDSAGDYSAFNTTTGGIGWYSTVFGGHATGVPNLVHQYVAKTGMLRCVRDI
ncbi:MAG: hypothetical protein LBN93_09320, partial [Candidatus Symbiothrix sp.]|nr:hypothetical protein [Candidatus Symbiothrix sp.]